MILHSYTISALGHIADSSKRDTDDLPADAVNNAGRLLDSHASTFKARIPLKGFGHIELDWRSEDYSCALATFSLDDEPLSTNVILSGLRPEADRKVLQSAYAMIRQVCETAEERPADGLLRVTQRPTLACIRWSTRERTGMNVVRDLEMCLAAAFLDRGFKSTRFLV
jgi:hypothetical protein